MLSNTDWLLCVCVHVLQNKGGGEGLRGCQGHLRSHTHHRFPQKTVKLQSVFSQERSSHFGANLPLFSSSFLSKLPPFTPTFLAPSFHSMFSKFIARLLPLLLCLLLPPVLLLHLRRLLFHLHGCQCC